MCHSRTEKVDPCKIGYPRKKFHPGKITHVKLSPKRTHDPRKIIHDPRKVTYVPRPTNPGQNSLGQMLFALKEAFPLCKLLPFTANAPSPPPITMLVAERRHTCQLIYEIFISFQHCNGGWGGGGSQLEISSKIQSVS